MTEERGGQFNRNPGCGEAAGRFSYICDACGKFVKVYAGNQEIQPSVPCPKCKADAKILFSEKRSNPPHRFHGSFVTEG